MNIWAEFTDTQQTMWVHALSAVTLEDIRSITDRPLLSYCWNRIRPSPSGDSQTPKFRCPPFPFPIMRVQSLAFAVFRFQNAIVRSPVIRNAGESATVTTPLAPSRLMLPGFGNLVAATVVDRVAPAESVPLKPLPDASATDFAVAASSPFQWPSGPTGASTFAVWGGVPSPAARA